MAKTERRAPEPNAILIHYDFYQQVNHFSDAQVGALVRMMLAYAISERLPTPSDDEAVNTAFHFLRPQLDADKARYIARCNTNARIAAERVARQRAAKAQQQLEKQQDTSKAFDL
ncbi:MAG: hypothetical protein GX067_00070 [Clostridiales bacterium]|jgi:hypothetical protein|nr:hypothetical protein [Clostridiales bacterium]